MADDDVEICNQALAQIGITERISSLDEEGEVPENCALFYDTTRRSTLALGNWKFARRQTPLNIAANRSNESWEFCYSYPNNCINFWGIVNPLTRRPSVNNAIPWDVYEDEQNSSKLIVTDYPNAVGEFTFDATKIIMWHHSAREALYWTLAARLAGPLKANAALARNAALMAQQWTNTALAHVLAEQQKDPQPQSELVTVRY